METDISGEYDDEDKSYQTQEQEQEGEIGTFESGSQDNGKFKHAQHIFH